MSQWLYPDDSTAFIISTAKRSNKLLTRGDARIKLSSETRSVMLQIIPSKISVGSNSNPDWFWRPSRPLFVGRVDISLMALHSLAA